MLHLVTLGEFLSFLPRTAQRNVLLQIKKNSNKNRRVEVNRGRLFKSYLSRDIWQDSMFSLKGEKKEICMHIFHEQCQAVRQFHALHVPLDPFTHS